MVPSTQKALYITKRFGDYVLGDLPVPKPGPGTVLIKVHSAGLNPADWKTKVRGYFYEKDEDFPAVLGADLAGEVIELGDGVDDFNIGDRVFTQGEFMKNHQAFQQYTLAFASTLSKIPSSLSFDEAATIAGALTAPFVGLYRESPAGLGLKPPLSSATQGIYNGTPFVVLGGASSVGQKAIQLARISGFNPIFTTASLPNADYLKSIGATHVLDRKLAPEELRSQIKTLTSVPIMYAFDSIATKSTQEVGLDILDNGGAMACAQAVVVNPTDDKKVFMIFGRPRWAEHLPITEPFYHDVLTGFLEKGLIKPNAVEVLPGGLRGVVGGLERLQNDSISRLKLVARPHETE